MRLFWLYSKVLVPNAVVASTANLKCSPVKAFIRSRNSCNCSCICFWTAQLCVYELAHIVDEYDAKIASKVWRSCSVNSIVSSSSMWRQTIFWRLVWRFLLVWTFDFVLITLRLIFYFEKCAACSKKRNEDTCPYDMYYLLLSKLWLWKCKCTNKKICKRKSEKISQGNLA